jgi:predicted metalloprotease with PDZ domain
MRYTITHKAPHQRYIAVEAIIDKIEDGLIQIQLPAWRPGRYELGNFAKNVRNFIVEDEKGNALPFNKVTKDLWEILTLDSTSIKISYEYFASTIDAGSTYTDDELLYVNPVNCLVYEPKNMHQECILTLEIPDNFQVACALTNKGNTLYAGSFDELADSPLIASPNLQHTSFEFEDVTHHILINGENTLDINRFTREVKQYTEEQVAIFNHFPTKDFHYLILFLPYRHRHGVEHKNSTVISHGPGIEFDKDENRNDLLAICSHELFHFWNIKRIRPAAMFPYDFSKENYSKLGYVYEGVTTYYGDYMLLRSGVLNFDEYSIEFSKDLQRHFDNEGRYNYSVAESSFDTWLDGYGPGAPARKVSIYVEGMLAALIADIKIRQATQNRNSLDNVMQLLYQRFFLKNVGYTEKDYKEILEEVSGVDVESYFSDIINGKGKVEEHLPDVLTMLGLEIEESNSLQLHEDLFGFKATTIDGVVKVVYCLHNSPADKAGLALGDTILSVNGKQINSDEEMNDLIKDSREKITLTTQSLFRKREVVLESDGQHYFKNYTLIKTHSPTDEQKQFFKAWSKQEF